MMRTIPFAIAAALRENDAGTGCVILKSMEAILTGFRKLGVVAIFALGAAVGAGAQAGSMAASPSSVPPRQWAADAAVNELKVINYGRSYLRYREHTINSHGDQLRDVIETRDGAVARLIMKEGRPLTPEEDAAEHERLKGLLDSPSTFAKHIRNEDQGKKLGSDMIALVPDAMNFSYTPGQPQRAERAAAGADPAEIVLDYEPNPNWKPPNTTSEALLGLKGRLWIDARTHFLTRMEGNIFKPVNVGWFVAHIFPGGKLLFEQTRITDQRWIFSRFTEKVDVRVVLVKTIRENTDISASNFAEVPEMSYQDAIRMLWATPLPH